MAILGGIGENTVDKAQVDIQQDLATVAKDEGPVLDLATTLTQTLKSLQQAITGGKVVITVTFEKK